jgi:hypothetical protein
MLISTAGYVALNICALTEWLDSRIAEQFMSIHGCPVKVKL